MKCPACGSTLTMTERQGVEIDYCPQCRGVWLDRGELDKIIERAQQYGFAPPAPAAPPPRMESRSESGYQPYPAPSTAETYERRERYDDDDRYERKRDDDYDEYGRGRKKKREGFLSELFDFD